MGALRFLARHRFNWVDVLNMMVGVSLAHTEHWVACAVCGAAGVVISLALESYTQVNAK